MLKDRIEFFEYLFEQLQYYSSRIAKEEIISEIPVEYKDDFDYIIYCLSNQVKFGYKYYTTYINDGSRFDENSTIRECLEILQLPYKNHDLSYKNIALHICKSYNYKEFFQPIVDKELRLGIGNSLLEKPSYAPMLAKKFEGRLNTNKDNKIYITEKLDGNRCIAHYEDGRWHFTSRNGKEMHVNFDMGTLPRNLVFDGEILSPQQVKMSNEIYKFVTKGISSNLEFEDAFNSTSGLINQHTNDKKLVFNIFDIQNNISYGERRLWLDSLVPESEDIRILPLLAKYDNSFEFNDNIFKILDKVTSLGGEGVMINLGDRKYEGKRTDSLLKLKKVQTIDMCVHGTTWGTGKYEGVVGGLECTAHTDDGKVITCTVGSGLTDEQRLEWTLHPEKILHHIVEVMYFSLSQNYEDKGTNCYSLRFPRLKSVRQDKVDTSEY